MAQSTDAEDEDDEDGTSEKFKKDNEGRPIKAKAVFRCFANPTKLAAPTVKTKGTTQRPADIKKNSTFHHRSENSRKVSNADAKDVYNEQNGYQHSTGTQQHEGEITNTWPSHMHTGYATGQYHSQNGRAMHPAPPSTHFANGQSSVQSSLPFQTPPVPPTPFTQLPQHQQSQRNPFSVHNSAVPPSPSFFTGRNVSSTRVDNASRDYAQRSSMAAPQSRDGEWRSVPAAKTLAPSPSPFAWSPGYVHQTLTEQNGTSSQSKTEIDQRARLNSQIGRAHV